jgi:hypothetical protein
VSRSIVPAIEEYGIGSIESLHEATQIRKGCFYYQVEVIQHKNEAVEFHLKYLQALF